MGRRTHGAQDAWAQREVKDEEKRDNRDSHILEMMPCIQESTSDKR